MTSEPETIIAFIFKQSGKKQLTFSEMYLTLSIKLKWFTPQQAKNFVKYAIEQDIITKKEDYYVPKINLEKTPIPTGFYPSKKEFEIKKEEQKEIKQEKKDEKTFDTIIQRINEKTKKDKTEVLDQIKKVENEKNLTAEVAALYVGKVYNIKMEDIFNRVEKEIFK